MESFTYPNKEVKNLKIMNQQIIGSKLTLNNGHIMFFFHSFSATKWGGFIRNNAVGFIDKPKMV